MVSFNKMKKDFIHILSSDYCKSFQKPNENIVSNSQIIFNQMNGDTIQVKTEVIQ